MSERIDLGAISAYAIAVENGFEGTESEWLASLKGEQGIQGDKGEKGDSIKGEKGDTGESGKSAYQIAVENGYNGTEEQWLASLKGDDGQDGANAADLTALKNAIYDSESVVFEIGGIDGTIGLPADNRKDRLRTVDFLDVPCLINGFNPLFKYMIYKFDISKNFIGTDAFTLYNDGIINIDESINARYVKILARNAANNAITSEQLGSMDDTTVYYSIPKANKVALSNIESKASEEYLPVSDNQISRLGWNVYNVNTPPQQSIPSYLMAYKKGLRIMLADIRLTSDGEMVCLHDADFGAELGTNYFRKSDGTELTAEEKAVLIADTSLSDLLTYDVGLYKGEKWRSTKVLKLEDFIKFCGVMKCRPMFETKVTLTETQIKQIGDWCVLYSVNDLAIPAEDVSRCNSLLEYWKTAFPHSTMCIRGGDRDYDNAVLYASQLVAAGFETFISFTNYETIVSNHSSLKTSGIQTEFSEIGSSNINTIYSNGYFSLIDFPVCSNVNLKEWVVSKILGE